jgi:hypothetical protein
VVISNFGLRISDWENGREKMRMRDGVIVVQYPFPYPFERLLPNMSTVSWLENRVEQTQVGRKTRGHTLTNTLT